MSRFGKITIIISFIALVFLSVTYFYISGLEKVYFIDDNTFNPAPKSLFINPVSSEENRIIKALNLLKSPQAFKGYSSEVPSSLIFNSVSFDNNICYIDISFKKDSGISSSYHEDRMLLSIFKTIKHFRPETEKFKINVKDGTSSFKHISTKYYMTIKNNNISITNR